MRLRKTFAYCLSCAILIALIPTQCMAASDENILSDLDTITPTVIINGESVELYEQFKNQEEALDSFLSIYGDHIEFIRETYDLDIINVYNAKMYSGCVDGIFDQVDVVPQEYIEDQIAMGQFFDLFENAEQNTVILNVINSVNGTNASMVTLLADNDLDDATISELNLLLPYTSEISVESNDVSLCAASGINITQAISYATSYATSPNRSQYAYYNGTLNGDCTNFLSQILENSGVSQVVTSSTSSGWWHIRSVSDGIVYHDHSNSWVQADKFCKYMGVYARYTGVGTFSSRLSKGDIIAFDKNSDGDYDHLGFVTDTKNTSQTYDGYTYFDFKVAQHTTNYHAWASSSTNGWEKLGDSGYTYAIIKR